MKVRCGFVTNSSSSSFIIAYKKLPVIDEDTLKKYPFLNLFDKIIESIFFSEGRYGSDTERGEIYTTQEEWNEYISYWYDLDDYDSFEDMLNNSNNLKDFYNKTSDLISNGYSILYKRVDYNDYFCSDMFYMLGKSDPENFIILESD